MVTMVGLPKFTIHGLRHTRATILMEKGVSPKVVSERLGHASPAITMDIYSHVLPDMQEKAALAIDAALAPKYIGYKPAKQKSPDFRSLGFLVLESW